MKKETSFTVLRWMTKDLGLSGNELCCYALIYGFSQDGASEFKGSYEYISELLNISKRSAIYIIERLVNNGYIEKKPVVVKGKSQFNFAAIIPEKNNSMECKNCTDEKIAPVQNLHPMECKNCTSTSAKSAPLNNNIIIDNNNTATQCNARASKSFDFFSALLMIGVDRQVASDWMQVRKAARAVDTETAFQRINAEITKSGASPTSCIRMAVEKNWRGFEAQWFKNAIINNNQTTINHGINRTAVKPGSAHEGMLISASGKDYGESTI